MQHNASPLIWERTVACLSYITVGVFGLFWFFVYAALLKKKLSDFLTINFIQSFLIMFVFGFASFVYDVLLKLSLAIPFIGKLSYSLHLILFATPIYKTLTLGNFVFVCFLLYLGFWALLGQLPYIPYLTNFAKELKRY